MRLIDADRLKELFIFTCTGGGLLGKISNMIIEWACSFVDEMPTIEAEPVRHGHWIPYSKIQGIYKCSVCGFLASGSKYCPDCGAKMNGGDESV